MPITTTRWSPDTCGCVLEYDWDTESTEDERVHTISKIVSKCKFHDALPDKEAHYDVVLEENTRKNKVLGQLAQDFSSIAKIDEKGNKVLKEDVVVWAFDDKRQLTVTIPLLVSDEKVQAQDWADKNLGADKVTIG